MTTKDQERKALEKIKKIVEDLGDESYIGFAFDGCFEIAEYNIEIDGAFSFKQRAESAERKVKELEAALEESNKDYEAAHDTAHTIEKDKNQVISRLQHQIDRLIERSLSIDDMRDCSSMIKDRIDDHQAIMNEAAAEIVANADHPEKIEFMNAVKKHRDIKSTIDYMDALKNRIDKSIESLM